MKLLFTLRDEKAEYFMDPIPLRTRAEAIRMLTGLVMQRDTPIGTNPSDFSLFEVGSFEPSTGLVMAHDRPIHVIGAWELVPQAGSVAVVP